MRRESGTATLNRRADAAVRAARRLRAPHGGPHVVGRRRPLRVADVALWYGERSGGIRTYLEAKVAHVAATRAFEHHMITPGAQERHDGGRHELRAVRLATANGYRIPLGADALKRTLRGLRPDVVLLHDPFWGPLGVSDVAHEVGAVVVAVHHGSSELDAAGMPGAHGWLGDHVYVPLFRAWMRRAARSVDAIMSVVDCTEDCGRPADLPLRLGVHEAFRPQPDVPRGDHVLYVGRLAREKGVFTLLDAAAQATEPWELRLIGSGPAEDRLRERARRLGIADRVVFSPFVSDRRALARTYAAARVVVMPGAHETFGLVGIEAAASGARVVACETAPSAAHCGELVHTHRAGDARDLAAAIALARVTLPDHVAAAALGRRFTWRRLFAEELEALGDLVARARG